MAEQDNRSPEQKQFDAALNEMNLQQRGLSLRCAGLAVDIENRDQKIKALEAKIAELEKGKTDEKPDLRAVPAA